LVLELYSINGGVFKKAIQYNFYQLVSKDYFIVTIKEIQYAPVNRNSLSLLLDLKLLEFLPNNGSL